MTGSSHPSSRSASSAVVIAATGAASSSMNSIRACGQRRVDRQIRRPGLQHRQDRHDRLGRPRKQQRHRLTRARTAARPADAPTGSPPRRARDRSSTDPRRLTATASGVRATCAANNAGIDTAGTGRANTARLPHSSSRRVLDARRAHPSTTAAARDRRSWPPAPAATARSAPRSRPRRTRRCRTRRASPVRRPAGPAPSAGSGWTRGW